MADWTKIVANIRKEEGGLSRAQSDSARYNPVPDGSGYHTNKGIQWKTFKDSASIIGYDPTPKLFYDMPDHIWNAIFKRVYWDAIGGDHIKSQAIANTLADFAWGAGPYAAGLTVQKVLGFKGKDLDGIIGLKKTVPAINQAKEKVLFDKLTQAKKAYYLSLPGQQANYIGWSNRLDRERSLNEKLIIAGAGTGLAIATAFTFFF